MTSIEPAPDRTTRYLWIAAALVLAIGLAAYLVSPVLAARSLVAAAKAGDAARVSRLVDFPAVRESLKSQLSDQITGRLQADAKLRNNPLAQLGMALAPMLMDKGIDALVTPDTIAEMVRSSRAKVGHRTDDAGTKSEGERRKIDVTYSYVDLNHFQAVTEERGRPDHRLVWILERRGLVDWKLVRIELPALNAAG